MNIKSKIERFIYPNDHVLNDTVTMLVRSIQDHPESWNLDGEIFSKFSIKININDFHNISLICKSEIITLHLTATQSLYLHNSYIGWKYIQESSKIEKPHSNWNKIKIALRKSC